MTKTEKRAENITFTANKHQYKKNFKKDDVRLGVCHCHKPGHWIKECRNRKEATSKKKKNTRKVHRKERRWQSLEPCLQNII